MRARGILDKAVNCAMSLERQAFEADGEESKPENIGSREAAALLGVSSRTVERNAEARGGRQVSGIWVFDRDEIGVVNRDGQS